MRNAIFPVASFGSNFGPLIVIVGFLFGAIEPLIMAGIVLFSVAVFFSLVTLPVEFNASRRALSILSSGGAITGDEVTGARSVLNAAAMTYVASALASVLTLLRLLLLSRRS